LTGIFCPTTRTIITTTITKERGRKKRKKEKRENRFGIILSLFSIRDLIAFLQMYSLEFEYCIWVFRFFFGKNKVMIIALGKSKEDEYKENLHEISKVNHLLCSL